MNYLNVPLPKKILIDLSKYALETGINKKKIVELALIAYLKDKE